MATKKYHVSEKTAAMCDEDIIDSALSYSKISKLRGVPVVWLKSRAAWLKRKGYDVPMRGNLPADPTPAEIAAMCKLIREEKEALLPRFEEDEDEDDWDIRHNMWDTDRP